MADEKGKKGIEVADSDVPAGVQSITHAQPTASPGSKDVGPSPPDTESEAPPLHTARPDVPIAQVLASGAGEHTPPDSKEFDAEGRPREIDAG